MFNYHVNAEPPPEASAPPPGSQPPVQGGTPAPTPPASPLVRPKKQQFQTDQTRPFVLPFSPANAGPKHRPRLVPQSIDEAGELYRTNMRVSTELWQTWKLREEYIAEESGVTSAEAIAAEEAERSGVDRLGGRLSALALEQNNVTPAAPPAAAVVETEEEEDEDEDKMDPLVMLKNMERDLRAQEAAETDDKKRKLLQTQRGDIQRLERIEVLYVCWSYPAPHMSLKPDL